MRQLNFYQDEFNLAGGGTEMSLVFFPDTVRHVLRIARILRQPRGNALLVGLAGKGLVKNLELDELGDRKVSSRCQTVWGRGRNTPVICPLVSSALAYLPLASESIVSRLQYRI